IFVRPPMQRCDDFVQHCRVCGKNRSTAHARNTSRSKKPQTNAPNNCSNRAQTITTTIKHSPKIM
ncbi:unnamed protein product, partial [Ceratitis capitata]